LGEAASILDRLNEPPKLEPPTYRRVVARVCEAVRQRDTSRLIIRDGRDWGNTAPLELAWIRDYVDLWTAAGWGRAMWNFIGSMGVIDSDRAGVDYENWHGHKLDRQMLTLVQGRKGT